MPEWTTFLPVYVTASCLRFVLLHYSQRKAHNAFLQLIIVLGVQNQGKFISAVP